MEASAERSEPGARTDAPRRTTRRRPWSGTPGSGRWRAVERPTLPDDGELHVYRATLESAEADGAPGDLARRLLAEMLEVAPEDVREEGDAGLLHFGAARAGSIGLLVLCRTGPVGVDLQPLRPLEELESRPAPFSDVERETLRRLPPGLRAEAHVQCLARKAALRRAVPDGLADSLEDVDVSLTPGAPPRIHRWRGGPGRPSDWTLVHLRPAPGIIGAVALRGDPGSTRLRSVDDGRGREREDPRCTGRRST